MRDTGRSVSAGRSFNEAGSVRSRKRQTPPPLSPPPAFPCFNEAGSVRSRKLDGGRRARLALEAASMRPAL